VPRAPPPRPRQARGGGVGRCWKSRASAAWRTPLSAEGRGDPDGSRERRPRHHRWMAGSPWPRGTHHRRAATRPVHREAPHVGRGRPGEVRGWAGNVEYQKDGTRRTGPLGGVEAGRGRRHARVPRRGRRAVRVEGRGRPCSHEGSARFWGKRGWLTGFLLRRGFGGQVGAAWKAAFLIGGRGAWVEGRGRPCSDEKPALPEGKRGLAMAVGRIANPLFPTGGGDDHAATPRRRRTADRCRRRR